MGSGLPLRYWDFGSGPGGTNRKPVPPTGPRDDGIQGSVPAFRRLSERSVPKGANASVVENEPVRNSRADLSRILVHDPLCYLGRFEVGCRCRHSSGCFADLTHETRL